MAPWGSCGRTCKRSVALHGWDGTKFGELVEKWVGVSFAQEKKPHSVLIAIFNTSCMEVYLEIVFFLKLLFHRAVYSVLMFLHRQEQAVGQADMCKGKSKGQVKDK